MQILKGMRYRVYLQEEQEEFLRQVSGCVRFVYNIGLEQRQVFGCRDIPHHFGYAQQNKELTKLKKEAPFLKDVPAQCLQSGLIDLQTSFDRFFNGISGYPTPRKRGENDGFRFPDPEQFWIEKTDDKKFVLLHLPKMGMRKTDHGPLKVRLHRPIQGEIRSVTLNHEADGVWYASFLCAVEIADPAVPLGKPTGVDRGVAVPIMDSEGNTPYVPVPTERQKVRERRLKKAIARCDKKSNNRKRAVRALGRHTAKEARKRRDALHKATTQLAKNHSLVVFEDLRIKNMTASAKGTIENPGVNVAQKSGLNRAILSVGWGMASVMQGYKSVWYGSVFLKVTPMGTSQECSVCGHTDAASRVTRDLFCCTACGHTEHADLNAAKVIRDRGLKLLATPEDTGSGSACGALCAKQGVEARSKSRKAGSPCIHAGE